MSENVRKSVSAAMRDAGYSNRSAEKPQRLTRSKGWQDLMDEHLPDKTLLGVHKGLLRDPDWRARDSGLDMAYKLKGSYKATKVSVEDSLEHLSDDELDVLLAEQKPAIERYQQYKRTRRHPAAQPIK